MQGVFEGDSSLIDCVAAIPWVPNPQSFFFCIFWFRSRKDQSVNFCIDPEPFIYSVFASGSLSFCPKEEFQMERPLLASHVRVCAGGGTWKCCFFQVSKGDWVFGGFSPFQEIRPQAVMALKLCYSSLAGKRAVTGASSSRSWIGGRGRGVLGRVFLPRGC